MSENKMTAGNGVELIWKISEASFCFNRVGNMDQMVFSMD